MYNPKSLKAEEFIDHQEILDTLAYADQNKDNVALIDADLEQSPGAQGPLPPGSLCAAGLRDPGDRSRNCTPWPSRSRRTSTATAL